MGFNKLVRIPVGTDLSRPSHISTANKDVINRSLQPQPKYDNKKSFYLSQRSLCRETVEAISRKAIMRASSQKGRVLLYTEYTIRTVRVQRCQYIRQNPSRSFRE